MSTSKRYAAHYDHLMEQRIVEGKVGGERPISLTNEELELATEPVTRTPVPKRVIVWLRYPSGSIKVEAEAVAWTEHAVAVRWVTTTGEEHRAWVWTGAVRGR